MCLRYGHALGNLMDFDLVDEMMWEDLTEFETLEEAGLESQDYDTVTAALQTHYWSGEEH